MSKPGRQAFEKPGTRSDRSDAPKNFGKRTNYSAGNKRGTGSRPERNEGSDRSDAPKNFGKRANYSAGNKRGAGSRPERNEGFNRSDAPKNFGKRTNYSTGNKRGTGSRPERNEGFDRPKSYEKAAGQGQYGKGLSKKSRFAKTSPPESFHAPGKPGRPERTDKKSFSGEAGPSKYEKTYKPKFSDDRKKGGSDSFGKPYKKTYKQRPDPEGLVTTRKRGKDSEVSTAPKSDKIRLNKYIANSGISSRREADELITMGLISVNGKAVTELGYKVNPGDEVRYEERVLRPEKPVYILMNKPKGFLTTTDDPQERKTVMHIIGANVRERIYPVGRLDRNTTGLLLLTNDGDLADKLMHPSFNVKKVYKVELDRALTKNDFQAIQDGVRLDEGRAVVDEVAIVSDDSRTVGIELHIGWNRVVRRIFESLGYEVVKLDRTIYAGLDKKELARGQWRFLTKEEIIHLKHFN